MNILKKLKDIFFPPIPEPTPEEVYHDKFVATLNDFHDTIYISDPLGKILSKHEIREILKKQFITQYGYLETTSELADNGNETFTYTSEDGSSTIISLKGY